jgi:energy-coupling factor transporter ATP-binding protein EcfA2
MYNYRKALNNDTRDLNLSISVQEFDRLLSSMLERGDGHALIVGKTGTGKSNILSLILNYLENKPGNIVVLDPHTQVSDYAILANSHKELIFLTGHDYSGSESLYTGINVLSTSGSASDSVTITEWLRDTISAEDIISHGTWGPRLEVILGPLLMECIRVIPGITLRQFQSLLLDRKAMARVLDLSSNSDLKAFIGTQMKDTRNWMDMISSTINKLLPMLENEELMRIVSNPGNTKLDIDRIIGRKNSLIVIDPSASGIGSSGYRIASVLILSKIWNALLKSGPTDKKTYIVIDEAHYFSEKLIETLLSEGRKYGIVLILSYQFLSQLTRRGIASLLGNITNMFIFACSNEDASIMARNITDDKSVKMLSDILSGQTGHSATFFSTSSGKMIGPKTIVPPKIGMSIQEEELHSRKIRSILENGAPISDPPSISENKISDHERIVLVLKEVMTSKGFTCLTKEARGPVIPDLIAEKGLKRIYFEVEISDLDNTFRLAKKLMDYGKEQLVFVTKKENVNKLIMLLVRILNMTLHGATYERAGKRILKNDVISSIFHIYIMCINKDEVLVHNGSDLVKFTQSQLYLDPFFIRKVRSLSYPELRLSILRGLAEGKINDLATLINSGAKGFDSVELIRFSNSIMQEGRKNFDISAILGL